MKTLKDFGEIKIKDLTDGNVVSIVELRQSAIEDIKELIKKHNELPAVNQDDEDIYATGSIEGQMKYIKQKFNITDEDLK